MGTGSSWIAPAAATSLANVRFGTTAPIALATDNENDTHFRTSNGLVTGTTLETYIFDKTADIWAKITGSHTVRAGIAAPVVSPTDSEGDVWIVTNDGLTTGTMSSYWVFDDTSGIWVNIFSDDVTLGSLSKNKDYRTFNHNFTDFSMNTN
jgi:hypothetical protein